MHLRAIVASSVLKKEFSFAVFSLKDGPFRQELENVGIECIILNYPTLFLPFFFLQKLFQKYDILHFHGEKAAFLGKLTQFLYTTKPTFVTLYRPLSFHYKLADSFLYPFSNYYLFTSYRLFKSFKFSYIPLGLKKFIFSPYHLKDLYFKALETRKRKKVLYFVSSYKFGGGEEHVAVLAKYIKKRYDPIFLIKKAPSGEKNIFFRKLVPFFPEIHRWKVGDNFDLLTLLRFPLLVKGRRVDFVHTHLNRAAILSFLSPRPVISTVHGLNRAIYYRFSDIIIAVSRFAARHLIEQGISPEQIEIIPNFVEIYPFTPRKDFPPVLIYTGRLHPKKRVDIALKVIEKLPPEWKLLVLGDGEERERLEKLAQELCITGKVEFLGYCQNVFSYLEKASFFILPSESESCPLSLLEAMERGVVPVVNNIKPLREILSDDIFFGNNIDYNSYVKKILSLYKDKEKLAQVSLAVRKSVERKHSPQVIVNKYFNLYQTLS